MDVNILTEYKEKRFNADNFSEILFLKIEQINDKLYKTRNTNGKNK